MLITLSLGLKELKILDYIINPHNYCTEFYE